jgi:hypothetical protein
VDVYLHHRLWLHGVHRRTETEIERERERGGGGERKDLKIKEVVGDTFIWGRVERRVSLVRTFPGFARSSF